MNIVIITVSVLATIAVFFVFVKFSNWSLFIETEPVNYARDVYILYARDVYILIENERHGYLYKKGDCPHDLSCKYHNLMEHFKNHEYYNIKAEKLLQLDGNFTVDELNKQCNELGKQYIPSPDYTDEKNLELLDKLWELHKARKHLMNRGIRY